MLIRVRILKEEERYYFQALGQCPIYMCASPQLLSKHPEIKQVKQLSTLPAIAYQHTRLQNQWDTGPTAGKVALNITMIANTAEIMLHACLSSLGIAFLPGFICEWHIANGELVTLFPEISRSLAREIYCLHKTPRSQSLKVDRFIKSLTN